MSHTYRHYKGDDGFDTLVLQTCDYCPRPEHCDCDSDAPSSDKSRNYVRSNN